MKSDTLSGMHEPANARTCLRVRTAARSGPSPKAPKESPRDEGLCGYILRRHRREAIQPSSLSQQRAAIVSAYLEDRGIASDRLITRGFGATHFIARNETADGRAQNRRIELMLME